MKNLKHDFIKYVSFNVLGMIGLSCYILVDTFFIAKAFGSLGLASLNFSISIYSIMQGLGLMTGVGAATEFSILNKTQKHEKSLVFTNAIIVGAILSIILIIVAIFFSGELSVLLGTDDDTYPLTRVYLRTILIFSPVFILNNIMLAFVRNDKNPKLAMSAMLFGTLTNIILDYVFIFVFSMGFFGAAFATVFAPIVSLCFLSSHVICKRNTFHFIKCRLRLFYARRILSLGFSSLIIEISSAVSLIVFNIVIMKMVGSIGVAAYGVVANIALIASAMFVGISQGMQPLASRYYGQGDNNRLRLILRYYIITSFMFSFVLYLLIFIFTTPIVVAFNSEGNEYLQTLASDGVRIYFMGYFFAALNITTASFFSAVSKPTRAMIISMLRSFVLLVPFVLILSHLFQMNGVWFSFVITEFIVFIVMIIFLSKLYLTYTKK